MTQMEEYIMGLSSDKLLKYITSDRSLHSAKELKYAEEEAKKRGIYPGMQDSENERKIMEGKVDKVSTGQLYYQVDDKTTGAYIEETYGGVGLDMGRMDSNNPFAGRHMLENDLDVTTILMWIATFVPIITGVIASNLLIPNGIKIHVIVLVTILDAILCIIDCYILKKHNYNTGFLWFFAIALAPVYMYLRMRLLKEKNYYHVVWILLLLILLFFMPK